MAGLRLLDGSGPLPLIPVSLGTRWPSASSGVSFMEPMHFAGKPLFSSDYFHKDRPRHVMTVATRITSVKAEPLNEDQLEVSSTDKVVSGDEIRQRFLRFYASRGHKIIPSSSLVPDDPTVLLTIAGMLQFKPVFLGKEPRPVPCATTAQRCIRTNDIENVGRTARHHTFFEMLGNFSFGDYFKKEAIVWAWELTTKEFGLPSERLWVSIFEDDDDAFNIWHTEVGVPKERIKRMGEDDNFWTSGVTGPCGPCSEIYYDFHPDRGYVDADFGDGSRFIELYNLVFMQYNKKDDGSLELLKQKNIDTGMGLERMAQVLQKVPNNYETDLIFPIIEKASNLAMISYANADDATKANFKIIGDHMRAVVYLISDGVVPSNVGRGYVVRRLIRRVVRTGKLLGIKGDVEGNIEGAFLPLLARTVIELCTNIDPDVKTRMPRILEELKREEIRFLQTLERGEKLLDQFLENALSSGGTNGDGPLLSGKDVFLLYDTYGFPVEITAEVAEERGVNIDLEGFELEMENQRRQSQAAHNVVKLTVANETELSESIPDTEFLGYSTLFASAVVKGLLVNGNPVAQVSEGFDVEIVLNRTPFYAESGGQIGDNGFLYCSRDAVARKKTVVEIKDVQKAPGGIFVHKGTIKEGTVEIGSVVDAAVDANLRKRARVHHTATHLLQAALKNVIGSETSQAGSLVAFDRLRFDFNFHRPLLEHEVLEIENLINNWIGDATDLQTMVMPLAEAKRAGAIAMFGEKYGEQVRVVEVPGVSMELCGGTHVTNTSEIRGFKIISEQGIASGIRRIEAVAGEAFIEYVNGRDTHLKNLCSMLKVRAEDVATRVDNILDELRMSRNEVLILRNKMAIMKASTVKDKAVTVGTSNIRFIVESMGDIDSDSLKSAAEYLIDSLQDPAAVVLGSCPGEGKVSLVAAFSPGVIGMGLQAGKFIGSLAKICGGGGGGRPNFAQAGGKKPENLLDALQKANSDLIAAFTDTK
ncbi:alanine--tRNA ligase, chloroplastic/mitochondrial isoform X1 [Dendrobium catenatum]|uniref:alanine--tRNA ligase, chloroplastic/mitochondrial isoform X1 n=2 Tax=Dendrobium catenatum TaxID=906689 RepID=UPI0009F188C7|nr:alanine--tRNA ligase, chloroplastic/mitochondrial isoform X1 [Dendrobium catenatum]